MTTFNVHELSDSMIVLAGWCSGWVLHFVRKGISDVARAALGRDEEITFD